MPYTQISELPSGVKDNLPVSAQRIYLSAFNSAYGDMCEDRSNKDECAAKIAWSAVKNSYEKQDGKWVKKKSGIVNEFSFHITKASFDKSSGEMRWAATASDTSPDLSEESMSIDLFKSFMDKIDRDVEVPIKYQSEAWKGGLPYVSVAHYDALEGQGIAGESESVYVDGQMLKSKGTFRDTALGRASFKSVCKSVADKEAEPVRISIAFLDMKHSHGEMIFERSEENKVCSLCARGVGNKVYLDGQLIHLALTRVPMNTRTDIEPEKVLRSEGMKTRKQDAESIIGEELAEELEKESRLVGKSQTEVADEAVVIKSEDDETTEEVTPEVETEEEVVKESDVVEKSDFGGATTMAEAKAHIAMQDEAQKFFSELMIFDGCSTNILNKEGDMMDLKRQFTELVLEFSGELSKKSQAAIEKADRILHEEKSELDLTYEKIKSVLDEIKDSDVSEEEKLLALQQPLNALGELLKSEVNQTPVQEEDVVVKSVEKVIGESLQPLVEQVSLLNARMEEVEKQEKREVSTPPKKEEVVIPKPRQISPSLIAASQSRKPVIRKGSIVDIARKSVGLESNYEK